MKIAKLDDIFSLFKGIHHIVLLFVFLSSNWIRLSLISWCDYKNKPKIILYKLNQTVGDRIFLKSIMLLLYLINFSLVFTILLICNFCFLQTLLAVKITSKKNHNKKVKLPSTIIEVQIKFILIILFLFMTSNNYFIFFIMNK